MIGGRDAWLIAASWGSYMHAGDPGACMYGFSGGPPQSAAHRDGCLKHIETQCMPIAVKNQNDEGCEDDIEQLEELVAWLKSFSDADLAEKVAA